MKPLKEALYDIISPTKEIAEGILDADDVMANTDAAIMQTYADLIYTLTGAHSVETNISNRTLYIKCQDNEAGVSLYNENDHHALMSNNIISHIVCDCKYRIRGWQISAIKAAGIESITAPTIAIEGECEFNCSVLNSIKLTADNFIIIAGDDRGKKSRIRNLNLKCKKTIKMISAQAPWGDELYLENITVDCNKVMLLSRQNFNTSFSGNPWESLTFSGMGFTPQSKFKQIDCFDDKSNPKCGIRYSKKKPKRWSDDPNSYARSICWEMADKPGWYCDTELKPTKAMLKM